MNENKKIVISLRELTKSFGNFEAVSKFSLDVAQGEIIGLLGPNGAGKTTTMKMIARLLIPSSGEVWIRNNGELELLTNRNKDTLLDHLGFLIENPTFYDHMTPKQILSYFALLKGYPKKKVEKRIDEVLALVGLSSWKNKKIGTFSKGMKQKLGIVSALVHDPDILVLDEPQTGLDPKARREIRSVLMDLKRSGKTIFLSSHLLYEVSEISDKIAIIYGGKLIAYDSIKKLEEKAQDSLLKIQLLKLPNNITETKKQLEMIIKPLSGLNNGKDCVSYNPDSQLFEVRFDGKLENQGRILKELTTKGIEIVDFSVPRTNSLEDLYVKLIAGLVDERKIK
ncbi:MAG: ABC transporter ATP-binding protein [Candidatus Heimdallarchaeaceae archaeon]